LDDELATREKALKTLVAGQQAENLLDCGGEQSTDVEQSFG
jgi:hypothetical protein